MPMHVVRDGKDYLDRSLPITDIYDYYERTKYAIHDIHKSE